MSARCCQQGQLYDAESLALLAGLSSGLIAPGELQRYVDGLRDSPYWERSFSRVLRIEAHVRQHSERGSVGKYLAGQHCGIIEMAPVHLTELYVLHEVAHVLAEYRYSSRSHDPWFARTYLELVSEHMGSDAYVRLRDSFIDHGVDHEADCAVPGGIAL